MDRFEFNSYSNLFCNLKLVGSWFMLSKWNGGINARREIFPEYDCVHDASQFLNVSVIASLFPHTWFITSFCFSWTIDKRLRNQTK